MKIRSYTRLRRNIWSYAATGNKDTNDDDCAFVDRHVSLSYHGIHVGYVAYRILTDWHRRKNPACVCSFVQC